MKKAYIWTFLGLLAIYILLSFILPPDPTVLAKHHMSLLQSRLLSLSFVIPISLIYLMALYGFIRVNDYAEKVRETKEGPHFRSLAIGLMILVFGLPIRSIIGSIANYWRHELPHLFSDITIFREYLGVIIALLAVYWLLKGARGLYSTLRRQTLDYNSPYALIGPVVLSSIFTWLVVTEGHSNPGHEPYFLPNWLVVTTLTIPYIVSWCMGAWAAIHLYKYQNGVKGRIYKRAIDQLAKGVAVIILISIIIEFLTTLSGLLNRLDLTPLLLVIYVLVGFYVVGYGLVARGAKKLRQIEEA